MRYKIDLVNETRKKFGSEIGKKLDLKSEIEKKGGFSEGDW